jgi:soluble lytic murein transglycosylase
MLVLLSLPQTGPFAASDEDFAKTANLMKGQQDPVARKLLTWLYVTGTDLPIDAKQLAAFVKANPGWPKLGDFREKIEKTIAVSMPPADVVAWFQDNPPETYDGIKADLDALLKTQQAAVARTALAAFWPKGSLNHNQTAALAAAYKFSFAPGAHAARLDHLLWAGRYEEAKNMLAFVDADTRALAQARIALAHLAPNADRLLDAVPEKYRNSESLLFERLRYRRRKNMDLAALDIIKAMPENVTEPELWWGELNVMARRAIEKRAYIAAYHIAEKHKLTSGIQFTQAEWLLGWLSLRYMNQPTAAYKRFTDLYNKVSTAISRARASYWAARAAEMIPDTTLTQQWDKVAAGYPSTFYGQLAYQKLYGTPTSQTFADQAVDPSVRASFEAQELVRAVRLLQKLQLAHLADPFLARLSDDAKTKMDYLLIARLAHDSDRDYYAVEANKELQQRLGVFLFQEGYPIMRVPYQSPEKALVHAIIHRESMFNRAALSPAGARGLMQLMPATARRVAKNVHERYNVNRLTADPSYNVLLGSAYLGKLVDEYGGFYPMAIAAYNAGPGNVADWIQEFGDPRKTHLDIVDWIESIPIYETRNYIQRVLECYYVYRLRFDQPPKTVVDMMPQK